MCATCGCSSTRRPRVTGLESGRSADIGHDHHHHDDDHHDHDHHHDGHSHDHHHEHDEAEAPHMQATLTARLVRLEQEVLAKNDLLAQHNRGWFERREIGRAHV